MPSSRVFVQLEPWLFQAPQLLRAGKKIDIGLLAEALVFYDQVAFGFTNAEQFVGVVNWFRARGALSDLVTLLFNGVLQPYYYAFYTLPADVRDVWNVVNIQDSIAAHAPVFAERVLESTALQGAVRQSSRRSELCEAAFAHHIEVKAEEFGAALDNARADYQDEHRAAALLQLVVDELHRDLGFLRPPEIRATSTPGPRGATTITLNLDLGIFRRRLGPKLDFHRGTLLACAAFGVKTLWSAAQLDADLYAASPLTGYARFKLDEGNRSARARAIVEGLVAQVAFPDIRKLVNAGQIGVQDVLLLRRKAERFRRWLRAESEFDRNAVVAYLGEIAEASGWKKGLGFTFSAAGIIGGAVADQLTSGALGGTLTGAGVGALAGEGMKFIAALAGKIDDGWKPRVFGQVATRVASAAKQNAEDDHG